MERSLAVKLVRTYVEGWKEYNSSKVLTVLDPDCILVESDGEMFHGAKMIAQELDKRIAGEYGPWKIHRWDIKSLGFENDLCFVEWDFEGLGRLEGASLIRFKDDKINYLREYCTIKPR